MEDLKATEGMREEGDWMAAFDLENQFFHVKLRTDAYKFFGFSITDEDGSEKYYCFTVLVYGFSSAVATVTRLIKPVTGHLHKKGIRVAIYVDDGQVAGKTKEATEQEFRFTLTVFQLAGWNVQWKKTSTQATQVLRYLGFEVDSINRSYRLPQDKLAYLQQVVNRELAGGIGQRTTAVRTAAELLGRLAVCKTSHGKVLHIQSRHMQHQVGSAAEAAGWDCAIVWQVESLHELKWIQENLEKFNDVPRREQRIRKVRVERNQRGQEANNNEQERRSGSRASSGTKRHRQLHHRARQRKEVGARLCRGERKLDSGRANGIEGGSIDTAEDCTE
jgi:hypothetical protein